MRNLAKLAAVIGALTIFGTGAYAMDHDMACQHTCDCGQMQGGHEGMKRDFRKFPWMLKEKLGLTGKQAGEISDIMEAEHVKAKPLFEAIHKERTALMEAAKTGDQAAIRTQAGKLADAETALAMHRAAVHKRIAAVMTKEQAEKFEKMAAEFGKHGMLPCNKEHGRPDCDKRPHQHQGGDKRE
jgi:Spy/CpxP family protein refolding chaperone